MLLNDSDINKSIDQWVDAYAENLLVKIKEELELNNGGQDHE